MTSWATPPAVLRAAVQHLDPPFGVLDDAALRANAADLVRRAGGRPIRVATKSVRIRALIRRDRRPARLRRAARLHAGRGAVAAAQRLRRRRGRLPDRRPGRARRADHASRSGRGDHADGRRSGPARPDRPGCAAGIRARGPGVPRARRRLPAGTRVHLGVRRSPVRHPPPPQRWPGPSPASPGFALVGMMAYEAQIAGVGNAGGAVRAAASCAGCSVGRPPSSPSVGPPRSPRCARSPTSSSSTAAAPARSRRTAAEPAVTEVAAGSGLFGPTCSTATAHFQPGRRVVLRAAGRAPARPPDRDPARRRLDRIRAARRATGCRCSPIRRACGTSARKGRRGADPGPRPGRPTGCRSATGCGCGTPRPASRPST